MPNIYQFCKKVTYTLDFSTFLNIYFSHKTESKMIDVYDAEALIKIYRMLRKRCEALDRFIENHAYYFSTSSEELGSLDVCNNIIDLMTRKNQLINLKLIIDRAISTLSENDKKILYIKMNYTISMAEICGIFNLKERTAFRRIEKAFENLSLALNSSKYINKLEKIIDSEDWITNIRREVKDRRMSYRTSPLMA